MHHPPQCCRAQLSITVVHAPLFIHNAERRQVQRAKKANLQQLLITQIKTTILTNYKRVRDEKVCFTSIKQIPRAILFWEVASKLPINDPSYSTPKYLQKLQNDKKITNSKLLSRIFFVENIELQPLPLSASDSTYCNLLVNTWFHFPGFCNFTNITCS